MLGWGTEGKQVGILHEQALGRACGAFQFFLTLNRVFWPDSCGVCPA